MPRRPESMPTPSAPSPSWYANPKAARQQRQQQAQPVAEPLPSLTEFIGQEYTLSPEQTEMVRQKLVGGEWGTKVDVKTDYEKVKGLLAARPELQPYSRYSQAFAGAAKAPGSLDEQTLAGLLGVTQRFQQPFLESLGGDTATMSKALTGLLPRLPPEMRGIMEAQIPRQEGLVRQVQALIGQATPGLIAQAYSQQAAERAAMQAGGGGSADALVQMLASGKG